MQFIALQYGTQMHLAQGSALSDVSRSYNLQGMHIKVILKCIIVNIMAIHENIYDVFQFLQTVLNDCISSQLILTK